MPTTQPRTLDAPDRIPALLADAFSANQDRPDRRAREQLSLELRSEIRRLLPKVQAQMDSLTPRTRAWYARDTAIDAARDELSKGLSPSTLAACLTITELGRRLRALDEFAGGES
ncbi:DUF6415 family natural product biosynthesis protein [Streptomyces sp. NBC_01361]|uniref:DUF6415 family natural product biosynthesis protein n=1 Tax=Streptomyces sp. NBC_01361 TaxID=2903838 RepID=UPI002E3575AC|nr:DUF6415 family natural product biosynthesis protein [Streptomyces sp. NBC_01361]